MTVPSFETWATARVNVWQAVPSAVVMSRALAATLLGLGVAPEPDDCAPSKVPPKCRPAQGLCAPKYFAPRTVRPDPMDIGRFMGAVLRYGWPGLAPELWPLVCTPPPFPACWGGFGVVGAAAHAGRCPCIRIAHGRCQESRR